MKPKKIRWIHRKFPRYYQWWWSLEWERKAAIVLVYVFDGILALITTSLATLIVATVAFVLQTLAIAFVCRGFKSEDLCK